MPDDWLYRGLCCLACGILTWIVDRICEGEKEISNVRNDQTRDQPG